MSQQSKREFLIGKDCNYSDTLLESNVPDIIAGAPGRLNPKYKDQFETTAQFDARVQQHKNELKNYNANMLKTIKVQNVPIYKLTDTKYSMFSYNADYKLLTIACRFNWCLGCSHRWIWESCQQPLDIMLLNIRLLINFLGLISQEAGIVKNILK